VDFLYLRNVKNLEVIIIGGGLAGLTAAIHLSQENFQVKLFETFIGRQITNIY